MLPGDGDEEGGRHRAVQRLGKAGQGTRVEVVGPARRVTWVDPMDRHRAGGSRAGSPRSLSCVVT